MSTIRTLSLELPGRSDEELRQLFAARPDLIDLPVTDFPALAARATSRIIVQRILDRLDTPYMQLLKTALLCPARSPRAHSQLPRRWLTCPFWSRLLSQLHQLALPNLPQRFEKGPVGVLPESQGAMSQATQMLLDEEVLVPLDERHVELPRDAGGLLGVAGSAHASVHGKRPYKKPPVTVGRC